VLLELGRVTETAKIVAGIFSACGWKSSGLLAAIGGWGKFQIGFRDRCSPFAVRRSLFVVREERFDFRRANSPKTFFEARFGEYFSAERKIAKLTKLVPKWEIPVQQCCLLFHQWGTPLFRSNRISSLGDISLQNLEP
jgi:hypothetical protein